MPWSRSNNHGDTWKKQPNLLTFITVALSVAKGLCGCTRDASLRSA
jgi:hypothetical protein